MVSFKVFIQNYTYPFPYKGNHKEYIQLCNEEKHCEIPTQMAEEVG